MPMEQNELERLIREAFPDASIEIRDLAGDGDHYAAHVVSQAFKGKSRVQQHQMVYQALQGQMGDVLHALALNDRSASRLTAGRPVPHMLEGSFKPNVSSRSGNWKHKESAQ